MTDHNSIAENHIAARYHLGELTEAECDAYEEHCFDCPECAEEMICGSEFMHYGRKAVEQDVIEMVVPSPVPDRPSWMRAVPVAVFAVLILGAAINIQFRKSGAPKQPQTARVQLPEKEAHLLEQLGESHGESEPIVLAPDQPLLLPFRIDPSDQSPDFAAYEAVIAAGHGKELVHRISKAELDEVVQWHLPAGALPYGEHVISIRVFNREGVRAELKGKTPQYPFTLVPEKN